MISTRKHTHTHTHTHTVTLCVCVCVGVNHYLCEDSFIKDFCDVKGPFEGLDSVLESGLRQSGFGSEPAHITTVCVCVCVCVCVYLQHFEVVEAGERSSGDEWQIVSCQTPEREREMDMEFCYCEILTPDKLNICNMISCE